VGKPSYSTPYLSVVVYLQWCKPREARLAPPTFVKYNKYQFPCLFKSHSNPHFLIPAERNLETGEGDGGSQYQKVFMWYSSETMVESGSKYYCLLYK